MQDTKTKILDAAETMIVKFGAEKASLRKITSEAGVNIAAINYHFGSKNSMVSAIIERLLKPLIIELFERLDTVMEKAAPQKPELEDIVRAYLVSLYNYSLKHPDHKSVFMQLFQSYDDQDTYKETIRRLIEGELKYYGSCLVKALPDIPKNIVLSRVAFFRNTAFGIMKGDCIMESSIEILNFKLEDDAMIEEMTRFVSAGLRSGYE